MFIRIHNPALGAFLVKLFDFLLFRKFRLFRLASGVRFKPAFRFGFATLVSLLFFFQFQAFAFGTELSVNDKTAQYTEEKTNQLIRNPDSQDERNKRINHCIYSMIAGLFIGLVAGSWYYNTILKHYKKGKQENKKS